MVQKADIEKFLIKQNTQIKELSGALQLKRIKHFLELLDNPQEKIKVIHIAGTSGKSSTAYLTQRMLQAQGFKVGLFQSPHLTDMREMFQINSRLLAEKVFVGYFNDLLPYIEKARNDQYGAISPFEILTGLAFYIFWKEHVDYAVIETGLGGLYDATNVINNKDKLVILTKIGLDHTDILGNTITSIATHKAGIIHNGNTVVSIGQDEQAKNVIDMRTQKYNAKLFYIERPENYTIKTINLSGSVFDFKFLDNKQEDIHLGLNGEYQVENCSEALAAVILLSKRDQFVLQWDTMQSWLQEAYFPGRMEIIQVNGKMVVIDGAHNPQKMESCIKNLHALFPKQKFDFLVAFKKGKDFSEIFEHIIPIANKIRVTCFHSINMAIFQDAEDPKKVGKALTKLGFTKFEVIPDYEEAVTIALKTKEAPLVITGSLYLIASIYPLIHSELRKA